jgi:hypothetical protein
MISMLTFHWSFKNHQHCVSCTLPERPPREPHIPRTFKGEEYTLAREEDLEFTDPGRMLKVVY